MSECIVEMMKLLGASALERLERMFRRGDMRTWIIARKKLFFDVEQQSLQSCGRKDALIVEFVDANGADKTGTYYFLSTRPLHVAIAEMLEEARHTRIILPNLTSVVIKLRTK